MNENASLAFWFLSCTMAGVGFRLMFVFDQLQTRSHDAQTRKWAIIELAFLSLIALICGGSILYWCLGALFGT